MAFLFIEIQKLFAQFLRSHELILTHEIYWENYH